MHVITRYAIAVFCAIFLITTRLSRLPSLSLISGKDIKLCNIPVCSRKLLITKQKRKIPANVIRSRSTEAPNVLWQFLPHYRRICGNGILIERCLLSLNAMARVTTGIANSARSLYFANKFNASVRLRTRV